MDIQVLVLNSESGSKYWINDLPLSQNISVFEIKEKICQKLQIKTERNNINIIFCGRKLPDDILLDSLCLGPLTNLTAILSDSKNTDSFKKQWINVEPNVENEENIAVCCAKSSFFVYCKKCQKARNGKLRALCGECRSSAVIFLVEPESWADVLNPKRLIVECKECNNVQDVDICLKCVYCNEISAPLIHVKRNTTNSECVICGSIENPCMDLKCHHIMCLDCFTAYSEQLHNQVNFTYKQRVGFTIGCPMFDCNAYIEDVHHFYLLGIDKYKEYQRTAAQLYFNQQSGQQSCPCGASFIVDSDNVEENCRYVFCPECSRKVCRFCESLNPCSCDEASDLNELTIQKISKKCPFCQSPTERNGGCAHIFCTQCKKDWCFVCAGTWTDNCQWDHWFE